MPRINPYNMLLQEFFEYCCQVNNPKTVNVYYYELAQVNKGGCFDLKDLYHRTQAAEQLGFDLVVKATEQGLEFEYVTKRPQTPHRVR